MHCFRWWVIKWWYPPSLPFESQRLFSPYWTDACYLSWSFSTGVHTELWVNDLFNRANARQRPIGLSDPLGNNYTLLPTSHFPISPFVMVLRSMGEMIQLHILLIIITRVKKNAKRETELSSAAWHPYKHTTRAETQETHGKKGCTSSICP